MGKSLSDGGLLDEAIERLPDAVRFCGASCTNIPRLVCIFRPHKTPSWPTCRVYR